MIGGEGEDTVDGGGGGSERLVLINSTSRSSSSRSQVLRDEGTNIVSTDISRGSERELSRTRTEDHGFERMNEGRGEESVANINVKSGVLMTEGRKGKTDDGWGGGGSDSSIRHGSD